MRLSKKLVAIAVSATVTLSAGLAFAAWNAGGVGSGTAKAKVAVALTTSVAANGSDLYPGATVALNIRINNPNPYPVEVDEVNLGAGAIASGDPVCDAGHGVTYTSQVDLALDVPAESSAAFSLPGSVRMSNNSADACQGETFTVPVSLVGHSDAPLAS